MFGKTRFGSGKLWYVLLVCSLIIPLTGCTLFTIRPLDPVTGKPILVEAEEGFDPVRFVDRIWKTQVLPIVTQQSIPYDTLAKELKQDREGACEKYGNREGTRPFNFLVTATGRVLEVDTSSLMGLLHVDLPPYDDNPDLSIQIGPVIRGTALRDALPFISFNHFTNQLEYADISRELHTRVKNEVLSRLDKDSLPGATITLWGAFTLDAEDKVVITPVDVKVGR